MRGVNPIKANNPGAGSREGTIKGCANDAKAQNGNSEGLDHRHNPKVEWILPTVKLSQSDQTLTHRLPQGGPYTPKDAQHAP